LLTNSNFICTIFDNIYSLYHHVYWLSKTNFTEKHSDVIREKFRTLHNQELCSFYRPPGVVNIMKSSLRWAGHIGLTGDRRRKTEMLSGNLLEIGYSENREYRILEWQVVRFGSGCNRLKGMSSGTLWH
jgi:hypothetical protein